MTYETIAVDHFCFSFQPPSECPRCHHQVAPVRLAQHVIGRDPNDDTPPLQIIYTCPNPPCREAFIATFVLSTKIGGISHGGGYKLWNLKPYAPVPASVPDEVSAISPSYVQIKTQAAYAEQY